MFSVDDQINQKTKSNSTKPQSVTSENVSKIKKTRRTNIALKFQGF